MIKWIHINFGFVQVFFLRFQSLKGWIIQCSGILRHVRKLGNWTFSFVGIQILRDCLKEQEGNYWCIILSVQHLNVKCSKRGNFNEMGFLKRIFPLLKIAEVNIRKTSWQHVQYYLFWLQWTALFLNLVYFHGRALSSQPTPYQPLDISVLYIKLINTFYRANYAGSRTCEMVSDNWQLFDAS